MAYIGEYPPAKNAQLVSLLFLKIRVDISGTFFLRLANCLMTLHNLYFNNVLLGKIKNTQPYEIKMK